MPARRDLGLDGLRGLAALSVLVFHVWLLAPADPSFSSRDDWPARVAHEGRLGLFLFFVLSGFLLYRPFAAAALTGGPSPSLRVYALRRAARILPAYYLALAGSVALLWWARGTPGVSLPPADKLWLFGVFGQNFSHASVLRLNGPMWTLAVEVAFYVVLPLLAAVALRQGRDRLCQAAVPLAAIAIGLTWNAWLARHHDNPPTFTLQLPAMLPYFGAGMLAAVVMHGRGLEPRIASRVLAAGLLLVVLDAIWDGSDSSSLVRHVVRDLPAAAGFALVLAAVAHGGRGRKMLANRTALALGAISYGVYLWQVPVILAARHWDLLPQRPAVALVVVTPCVVAIASASWLLLERPVLRRAHAVRFRVPAPRVRTLAAAIRSAAARLSRVPVAVYVVAVALAALLAYGPPYAEYDSSYILIWGRDLAGGHLPSDFATYYAPTPHPLANLVGALLAPLGHGALPGFEVVALIALGGLAVAAFALGARLFGPAVGIAFAALLVTRPLVIKEALVASVDIPAMALVLAAAAAQASRRRPALVMALLLLAGLLRPEVWLLSLAYAAYALPRAERRERTFLVGLAAAAPALWLTSDLLATGDALHSLHWTQFGADRLDRPQGLGRVVTDGPGFAMNITQPAVLAGGVAGALVALRVSRNRALLPLAIAVLGVAGFVAIGTAHLAVLQRYLLIPAAIAVLFCAEALVGWSQSAERSRLRAVWTAGALTLAFAIALGTPAAWSRLSGLAANARAMHREDGDLRALAPHLPAGCGPLQVAGYRQKPLLAFLLKRRGGDVGISRPDRARRGVLVASASGRERATGFREVYSNGSWVVLTRCNA